MDWQVIWSEYALSEMESAIRHVAEHSPAAAEALRVEIFAATDNLARFPELGAVYEPDESGLTREIISGRYRIFYRPLQTLRRIDVLLLWHSARREPRLPT